MTATLLNEGKTKKIWATSDPQVVLVESKDDITAGDGARHDLIPKKAQLSTRTTSNVFTLLHANNIPTAFLHRVSDSECAFLAQCCTMLPYEVVVRREAHGSYLKRHPKVERGRLFASPLVEFYLKTKDRKWHNYELLCDDPLMHILEYTVRLFYPAEPVSVSVPFLRARATLFPGIAYKNQMEHIALDVSRILGMAWERLGYRLADFKIEFGISGSGELLVADVIDNDSWRLVNQDGDYVDKQVYRDGGNLEVVRENYQLVAELSDYF